MSFSGPLSLVVEHRLQPRLRRIKRQVVTAPLHRVEAVLYEVAADAKPLRRRARWGRRA